MSAPTVLSIAGSDPSGGAGIQADLKTFSALGAYGCAAMTALTAQSTQGVTGIHPVPPEFVREQVATLVDEAGFSPDVAGHHVGMTRAINDGRVVGRRPGTTVSQAAGTAMSDDVPPHRPRSTPRLRWRDRFGIAGGAPVVVAPIGTTLAAPAPAHLPPDLDLSRPFFVALGTIEPRKNHLGALDAWRMLIAERREGTARDLEAKGINREAVATRMRADVSQAKPATEAVKAGAAARTPKARKTRGRAAQVQRTGLDR